MSGAVLELQFLHPKARLGYMLCAFPVTQGVLDTTRAKAQQHCATATADVARQCLIDAHSAAVLGRLQVTSLMLSIQSCPCIGIEPHKLARL
jgi:hypothetical protein